MIADTFSLLLDSSVSVFLGAVLCAFVPALLWRFVYFRIQDWRYPDEPREFPNWIPVLGHAISFFKDSHGTLTAGREYFKNTREPFSLTIAGQRMYVLTSPQDVTDAYKNTVALTFDGFVRDIMVAFEASPSAVGKMWLFPQNGGAGYQSVSVENPSKKCLAQLTRDFHHQQLLPGPHMTDIGDKFLHYINNSLRWQNISRGYVSKEVDGQTKEINLKAWCGDVLLEAATRAFFGDALLKIQPDLFQHFFAFDDNSWMLVYKYPRALAKDMYNAKDATTEAVTKYFELPHDKRPGEAWFVRTLEAEQRSLGIGSKDIALLMVMVYWVVNSNTYKMCFWIFSYILYHPRFLDAIREETQAACEGRDDVDMAHLLERSPYLNAVFDEVMRITNSSSSIRRVDADVRIGGLKLREGTNVLIPYRQLHFNEDAFGSDVRLFNPDRFLKNKSLSRNPSYRPFGGGSTYCPGRFIARQEVVAFVAIVLYRYDITLAGSAAGFPALEEMKPCLGVMGPVEGTDLPVRLSLKKNT